MMKPLNERWVPENPLTVARDRGRMGTEYRSGERYSRPGLNDTQILNFDSHTIRPPIDPMINPLIPPISPRLIRRMGEDTIQQRREMPQRGNPDLWQGTPIAGAVDVLGDPDFIGPGSVLADWDRIGWEWDRRKNRLCAWLTKGNKTWGIKLTLKRLERIFNEVMREDNGGSFGRSASLDGFFKKLGRAIKKGVKKVVLA